MLIRIIDGLRYLERPFELIALRSFLAEEEGLEVAEWFLVLGGVIVPLAFVIFEVMYLVARFYSFNSWVVSLPFL